MSRSERIVRFLLESGIVCIHRDDLRDLTSGKFSWAGANAGLFGGRHPWMESAGALRRISLHGLERIRRV